MEAHLLHIQAKCKALYGSKMFARNERCLCECKCFWVPHRLHKQSDDVRHGVYGYLSHLMSCFRALIIWTSAALWWLHSQAFSRCIRHHSTVILLIHTNNVPMTISSSNHLSLNLLLDISHLMPLPLIASHSFSSLYILLICFLVLFSHVGRLPIKRTTTTKNAQFVRFICVLRCIHSDIAICDPRARKWVWRFRLKHI